MLITLETVLGLLLQAAGDYSLFILWATATLPQVSQVQQENNSLVWLWNSHSLPILNQRGCSLWVGNSKNSRQSQYPSRLLQTASSKWKCIVPPRLEISIHVRPLVGTITLLQSFQPLKNGDGTQCLTRPQYSSSARMVNRYWHFWCLYGKLSKARPVTLETKPNV